MHAVIICCSTESTRILEYPRLKRKQIEAIYIYTFTSGNDTFTSLLESPSSRMLFLVLLI